MRSRQKIFPAHAGEIANKLLAARGDLVARFVDSYVAEFDRRGLTDHPQRHRELLATLGREVLLVMVAQVNAELPRYLTPRGRPLLRADEVQVAEAFSQEFLTSLGRASQWTAADAEEFRRDLYLYAQLSARTQRVKRRHEPTDPVEGPFVDRCALLLDPSMLDEARHASGKLLVEIERTTDKTLASVFRRRTQ